MADAPAMTLRTRFRRVVQVAPYETKEAEVAIEQAFTGEATPEDIMAHVNGMFVFAQASVFMQLGLGFEQDPETGIIAETFPGAQVVAAPAGLPGGQVARAAAQAVHPSAPANGAPAQAGPQPAPAPAVAPGRILSAVPAPAAPAPAQAARPLAGPGPGKKDDQADMWHDLMQNPGQWQDCRPLKASGQLKATHPDFKSTVHTQPGSTFKVGLWADRAPEWVTDPFPQVQ